VSEKLRISTFGGLLIQRDGEPVTGLASRKAEALLVYLACTGRPHSRESLATMFWDDRSQSRALGNLSVLLTSLRKHLAPYLIITRQTVAFNLESKYWIDVARVKGGLDAWKKSKNARKINTVENFELITGVLDSYDGNFLEGFYIRDSQGFEEWALMEREHWRWRVIEALDEVVTQQLVRGEYWEGIRAARRLLEMDPLRERTHRHLMVLLSRSGQRSGALTQFEVCRSILKDELGVQPSRKTKRLYDRIRAARRTSSSLLPTQGTPFLDRKGELAEVLTILANPDCRLLTILGPGGIGKSRLALRVGESLVDVYLNGVGFISLAAVSSPEFLISTIAENLGLQLRDQSGMLEQLVDYLRDKEILLILDNFEHLQGGINTLIKMMRQVPNLKLLVTSRERLNLREEWLFDLDGLHYPGEHLVMEDKTNFKGLDIESYAAVQLFLQGAHRIKPNFHIKGENGQNVARICQLLEGMPLGIELVSTWVRSLSCQEITRRIEGNLETLATTMQDMPKRHRSMLTVFDHSWKLLDSNEQRTFMKLSVFRGGFDRIAAEKVTGASTEILSKLVDKTLVRITPSKGGESEGRYEIQGLLRQYGARKLSLHPNEHARTRELHCIYYSNLLNRKESLLHGVDQKTALEEMGLEIENIRLAWQEACEHSHIEQINKSLSSLYRFYFVRAWFQEGQKAFERAVTALVGTGHKVASANQAVARTVGRLIVRKGIFYGQLSRYEEAETLLQEGLSIHRELDIPEEIAFSLDGLGQVYRMTSRYELARKALEESFSIYQEIGHRLGVADVLNHLCNLAYRTSDYAEAEQYLQETLSIRREFGDQQGIARCLLNLGTIVYRGGRYERAEQLARESLSVCESIGDHWGISACLNNLGNVAERLGKYVDAKELYEQSLEIKEDIGHRASIATSLYNLGKIAHHLGENEKSIQLYDNSIRIITEIGNQWSYANALQGLGIVLLAVGSSLEAEEKMLESLRIAQEIGVVVLQEAALVGMAEIFAHKGEIERAIELLALVSQRPSREKEIQDKAETLLASLNPQLSSSDYNNAFNRGGKLEFDMVVAEMLEG